jgi:UDP-N-acetylglucosamine transferase subunit ALG13
LTALQLGKCPVLVPREYRYNEHVDDHQGLIGEKMESAGFAVVRTVEDLTFADLELAARCNVKIRNAPPLRLQGWLGKSFSRL